jgi:DNA-binding NarL/FixJ family response regulator
MKRNFGSHCLRVGIIEPDPLRVAGFQASLESEKQWKLRFLAFDDLHADLALDVLIVGQHRHPDLPLTMWNVKKAQPGLHVIVSGPATGDDEILEALNLGARGYVNEAAPLEEFRKAIRVVAQGEAWAPRRVLGEFVARTLELGRSRLGYPTLTRRERGVLEMVVLGRSNKEIAALLSISLRTVKSYVARLLRKVGAENRILLSVHALDRRLVSSKRQWIPAEKSASGGSISYGRRVAAAGLISSQPSDVVRSTGFGIHFRQ